MGSNAVTVHSMHIPGAVQVLQPLSHSWLHKGGRSKNVNSLRARVQICAVQQSIARAACRLLKRNNAPDACTRIYVIALQRTVQGYSAFAAAVHVSCGPQSTTKYEHVFKCAGHS